MRVFAQRMADGEVSPKAFLAAILPALTTLILALLDQLLSPDMDVTLKLAIVGLVGAIAAFAGAWAGKPGYVEVPTGAGSVAPVSER